MVPDEKVEMVPHSRAERILAVVLPLISLFPGGGTSQVFLGNRILLLDTTIQRYKRILETEGYNALLNLLAQ